MSTSKIIIYLSVLAIAFIIGVPTLYKVVNKHYENLYKVTEKKITDAAKKCYYEGKCEKNILLSDLYEKGYLEQMSDPVTKVVYSSDSYILVNEGFTFYPLS